MTIEPSDTIMMHSSMKAIGDVEGGNHAQFGSYGEQSGDGTATMSGSEQLKQAVDAIVNFVQ